MKGKFENRSPYIKLCILALIFFACAIIATALSSCYTAWSGYPYTPENLRLLLLIQNSILFIASPLIAQYLLWEKPASKVLCLDKPKTSILLLGCATMIVSSPLIDTLNTWNQGLQLPESMHAIEQWMILNEKMADSLTQRMLQVHNWGGFVMNILVIAVLAGIGEELIFRGVLQKIFTEWTKNIHAGILITAFIFSAIHFQFFGFVPRFVLGCLLGYLFVWGKSLWIPILAHTLNNSLVVIFTSNDLNKGWWLTETITKMGNSVWLTLLSLVLVVACMWKIKTSDRKS